MSLAITVAGTAIPTDASALKGLQSVASLAFSLESKLAPFLDAPLARVPASASKSSVSYTSPAASWTPGPVQFGLQGGAAGALEIITAGDLVPYTDGLDSPQQKSIPVRPNLAYTKLTLSFNLSANLSANYSGGSYGVKSALDTSALFAITFCKAFAPSTPVLTAIAQTFESFVFPLHKDTLDQMSDGDYLLHEFDGNLHLSFGAYAGLDQVLYAGQSSIDVIKAFNSPLATLAASTKPEIKLGATLDFAFQYAARFEALLSKAAGSARLHLFRSAKTATSTTLKAGLTFDANTSASISARSQTVTDSLVNAAGGADSSAGQALSQVLSAGTSEIDKYVTEVNDKLTSWLNRANGVQANLQVAIETSNSRTILVGYQFDLGSPQYHAAWNAAINGDFVVAFQTGAVTLDVGSGLERAYQSRTSFSCNFFNLWSLKTWNDFTSNVSLAYAGNNTFHFIAKVGRTTQTESMGAMRNMDFYFSAAADVAPAGQLSSIDVDLHIDLSAQADPSAADRIATLLGAMEGGPFCDDLARGMHAFAAGSPRGTAQLQVAIPSSAYNRVHCDPYLGDKPQTNSNDNDSQNWNVFAQAADDLSAWPLRRLPAVSDGNLLFFKSFHAWEALNEKANGSNTPNRVNPGNPYPAGNWPENFPSVDDSTRQFIVASMMAGQSFMNFCADLCDLASAIDLNSAGTTWEGLLKLITKAIRKDLNVDFLRPAALATIRVCRAPGSALSVVSGPAGAAVPANHFAVAITL